MTLKILVVDDEADVPMLIRQRFRKDIQEKRIDFRFAGNGVEALAVLEQEPDTGIVLCDINMPEMDGLTLLSRLSVRGPLPKSVIVSAYGDMDNIRTAMNRGAFDFLTKPIDFKDLQATIEKTSHELLLIRQALETRDELTALRHELKIAATIQGSLLPPETAAQGAARGFDLYARVIPARAVGGDFYDYFMIDERHLGFLVADVSGKGVGAAIYMAVCRTMLRAIAHEGVDPATCLRRVNDRLSADGESGMFVTVFYGILDLETGEIQYAKGGHPPPFLAGGSGVRMLDMAGDMVLGLLEGQPFEVRREHLAPEEFIVLYSDGVSEAMDEAGELLSTERTAALIERAPRASSRALAESVIAGVADFQGDAPQADDITVLALGRPAGPPVSQS
jgi:sigma-B regulation protein RsbU (phosphoserine phosphatase)